VPRTTNTWDERALLLLGVLMTQSQHGYQINDFIETSLCRVADMKKATAYAQLDRLHAGGMVDISVEQVGNRPPRKVYSITEAGRELFHTLLAANLAAVETPTYAGDIGLMFINHLPRREAVAALKRRLALLDDLIANQPLPPPHSGKLNLDLAVEHVLALRTADRDWLEATIDRLEAETTLPERDRADASAALS
jgi:DNA-binding PadR family transcriptional regulator